MSHLDSILVTIFLILVFILIISIIACVVYRRSFRSKKKGRNSKKNAGKNQESEFFYKIQIYSVAFKREFSESLNLIKITLSGL